MTIKDVCKQFGISADTLRYYERVGVIPEVHRTAGGIRNYTEEDLGWVETAACFRSAGMPVDLLAEYVRLFKEGDSTIPARCALLKEARARILAERQKYDDALKKWNTKSGSTSGRYRQADWSGMTVPAAAHVKQKRSNLC